MRNRLISFIFILITLDLFAGVSAANSNISAAYINSSDFSSANGYSLLSSNASSNISVAYIYSSDISAANSYKSLLDANQLPTSLINRDYTADSNFSEYDLIIIGSDLVLTGSEDDAILASAVKNSGRSVVALGNGGYSFFGQLKLDTGAPNGLYSRENSIYVTLPSHQMFNKPNNISIPKNRIIQLYNASSCVGIYHPLSELNAFGLGREIDNNSDNYPLTLESDKYFLWGFTGSPDTMTDEGKALFVNAINYMGELSKEPNWELGENGTGEIKVYTDVSWNPDAPVPTKNETSNILFNISYNISGPNTYTGNKSHWRYENAPAGTYTINYGPISGYEAPDSETKTLAIGNSITFSDNYLLKKKAGDSLNFGDGYVLLIKQIDPDKNQVLMELQLEGAIIDNKIIKEKETYSIHKESFSINNSGKRKDFYIVLKDISQETDGDYIYIFIYPRYGGWGGWGGYYYSYLTIITIPTEADLYLDSKPKTIGKSPRVIKMTDLNKHIIRMKINNEWWKAEYNFTISDAEVRYRLLNYS